jgi:outer membrane protein assembly factor BamB
MNQPGKSDSSKVIRWTLLILGAMIIGSVLVNSFALSMFYPRFGIGKKTAAIPEKWQFAAAGPITAALALADDGTLYAASQDGFLYALDASGNLKWKFNSGPMKASPAIGADGTIYVSNEEQRIFAIDRTGAQQWAAGGGPFADKQVGSTAAALDQNYLYTPWRGQIRAIRLSTGTIDWDAGVGYEQGGSVTILRSTSQRQRNPENSGKPIDSNRGEGK